MMMSELKQTFHQPTTVWFVRVLAGGLVASMVLSFRLWWLPRSLPVLGLINGDIWVNNTLCVMSAALALSLLVVPALKTREQWRRVVLVSLLLFLLILVILDLTRLQPWIYFYAVLFALAASGPVTGVNGSRVFLSSMYIWAGINKFSYGFVLESTAMVRQALPLTPPTVAFGLSLLLPLLEILIGAGLLFPRYFRLARLGAYGLHSSILLLLILIDYNPVVWPWNITIPLLLSLLPPPLTFAEIGKGKDLFWPQIAISIFFLSLPALYHAGVVFRAIGWQLYSANDCDIIWQRDGHQKNLREHYMKELSVPLPTDELPLTKLKTYYSEQQRRPLLIKRWAAYQHRPEEVLPYRRINRGIAPLLRP